MHYEYFSVPETPDYENHDFVLLRLARSGREVPVPADQSAADALIAAGYPGGPQVFRRTMRRLQMRTAGGRGGTP